MLKSSSSVDGFVVAVVFLFSCEGFPTQIQQLHSTSHASLWSMLLVPVCDRSNVAMVGFHRGWCGCFLKGLVWVRWTCVCVNRSGSRCAGLHDSLSWTRK